MIARLKQVCQTAFFRVEAWFNLAFGASNPLYHLGALGFYFFYIMFVSGVYLFFYYEPTVEGSYDKLHHLSREQWYLGGVMRSLHRYAADAMVLVMGMHMLRELVMGRFHGARWFSWITGVPVLWLLYMSGIVGFWLVWDTMGQFLAVRTSEWLDWLPLFAEPMARNFLTNVNVGDLFFRLLFIIHLGLPLFLLIGLLVHIKKVSKASILPPRGLAAGTLAAMLFLSFIQPTVSHQRADLGMTEGTLNLDWFYMFPYPLMDMWSMGAVWALIGGSTLALLLLPWLLPQKGEPVAAVNLDYCSGCGLCAADCPYEAIAMRERSDGHPHFWHEAYVIASNCVHCGICTGACPSSNPFRHASVVPFRHRKELKSGIEMPQHSVDRLRLQVRQALAEPAGAGRILLVGCDRGISTREYSATDVASLSLPCIGMLPPAMIEYALRQGAAGVFLTGCRMGDCYQRLGNDWLDERLGNRRRPFLRRSLDRSRIGFCWAAPTDHKQFLQALDSFRRSLQGVPEVAPRRSAAGDYADK